jgi:spore coat polysaccharide biosynthesis predicted glycosyltransferase SpsG
MGKNTLNVSIHANEGYLLGRGHIMRCVTLAQEMQKEIDAEVSFVTNSDDPLLSRKKFTVYKTSPECSYQEIRNIFIKIHPEVIIYDIPDLTESYVAKTALPQSLVVVFDYYNRNEILSRPDMVFNFHHSEGIEKNIESKFFEGLEYAILRNEFHTYSVREKLNKGYYDVLITTGSSDPHGITKKILSLLLAYEQSQLMIHVIIGEHNRDKKAIYELSKRSEGRTKIYDKVTNMAELMSGMDFVVVSGGVTLFETISLRVPSIVVCAHEHAFELATFLSKKKCAVNLGYHNSFTKKNLFDTIDKLTSSEKINEMRDNLSSFRINGASQITGIIHNEVVNQVSNHKRIMR